jgi:RND family efflux transporter MFP subunit
MAPSFASLARPALRAAALLTAISLALAWPTVAQTDDPSKAIARSGTRADAPSAAASGSTLTATLRPLGDLLVYPERDAPAQVVARNESKVAAEQAGIVSSWSADVGEPVRRDQLIAQLDPRDAELGVLRAQAALDAATAREQLAASQLKRARELVAQGFFSQEALTQRETENAVLRAEINAAQASLATARRQLEKTRILAPFDGVIRERLAQRGESVAPGTVLFVISERGANELSATINPAETEGLSGSGSIRFIALGRDYPVRLLRIASTVNNTARTQIARLAFADGSNAPPAGLSGTLQWRDARPHVPASLPVRRRGELGLFVVDTQPGQSTGTARFVPLPSAQEARVNPVSLPPTTLVVIEGQMSLREGDRVTVKLLSPSSASPPANGRTARP